MVSPGRLGDRAPCPSLTLPARFRHYTLHPASNASASSGVAAT